MKWLGITLDIADPDYQLTVIRILGQGNGNQVELTQLADISLLELFLEMKSDQKYDRVVFYDLHELESWSNLKVLTDVCTRYGMSFSFLRQDLHSDEKVDFADLIAVI